MKRFAQLLLLYVFGLLLIVATAAASAQVTDPPIPVNAAKVREVSRTSVIELRTCSTWYYRVDKHGTWHVAWVAVDGLMLGEEKAQALLTAWKTGDYASMISARTHNLLGPQPTALWRAVEPCVKGRLPRPPGPWIVAPSTSAATTAPVYLVKLGVRSTTAVAGQRGIRGAECACEVLALSTSASTYCPLRQYPINSEQVTRCGEWRE
ncbi:MAG: hypothetical protein RLZZ524_466 [Pseudomonadota bacterium]